MNKLRLFALTISIMALGSAIAENNPGKATGNFRLRKAVTENNVPLVKKIFAEQYDQALVEESLKQAQARNYAEMVATLQDIQQKHAAK